MVRTMHCSTTADAQGDVNGGGDKNGSGGAETATADTMTVADGNANGISAESIKEPRLTPTITTPNAVPIVTAYHNGNGWVTNNSHYNSLPPLPHVTPTVFAGGKSPRGPRGQSPNRPTRYTPSPHSRGTSPNEGGGSGNLAPPPPPPPLPNLGPTQHVVHLHVNPGEAISFQMGDQMQLIQGPATVRMVSNNPSPPIPMPVHVPPGHMVQQIVDENGTLRHVILSPQPPMSVPMGPTYAPGPAPNAGPTSPHFYAYPPPYPHHPHPQYHHPHPAGPPPPTHIQPQGVTQTMHGQVPPLTSHQCNSHRSHQGPSPPPPPPTHHQHKDERTQRQLLKLKRKLDARQQKESSTNISTTHTATVIPSSPKKDNTNRKYKDRNTSTSGLEDSEENNAQDEEESRIIKELLSKVFPPTVSEIDARSALLRWKPPDMYSERENKCNDFAIQESEFTYEVLLSDRGKENKCRVMYSGAALEYKLTDLKPATEYHVCLQAILEDLKGVASEAAVFRTESCEPDCPQPPKMINRTKTSLTLKWNAAADNGSRITNYTLECDEGRGDGHFVEVFSGVQKQTKLIKLSASTCYRFRLTAFNEIGRSKTSDVVAFVTTGSPPSQPLPPALKEAHVNRLLIAWHKRPTDDEFSLQMEEESSGHGFLAAYNGKETQCLCTNLLRNTEYKFRLCAINDEGSSRWSDVISCCTRPDCPSMPNKPYPKGRIHSTGFKVTWDSPKDNGGSKIENYVLEMDSGHGFETIYSGLENEAVCDHLQPGTVYRLRVCAFSQGGKSDFSEVGNVMTLPVCPGACPIPRIHGKPRATTLLLKWAPPEYDGGSSITEYEVEMTSPDNSTRQVYRGRDLECLVASLLPGRPYLFQVRAYNKIGCGPWSELLEVVSGAGPPDRPAEPRVTFKSPHIAVVSWEEPVNNGATITEFRLDWSTKDSEFTQLFQGLGLNFEVKNLSPATQYNFRLRAVNSSGSSPASEVTACTSPPSSPGAISSASIKYTCTARSIHLTWREPASNGSDIILYNVDLGEKHPLIAVNNAPECTIDNLSPETTFRIRIQAVNCVGVGPFTSTLKVSTLSLPPQPPRLECTRVGHNSLVMKWGEGKNVDFTQYTLEMENRGGHFVPIYQGTSLLQKVSKLSETTEYRFRICAANDAGSGPYSDVFTCVTCKAPPPALKPPRVSEVTETSCHVEWLPAKPVGDDAVIYQVQLLNAKEQEFRLVYKGSELSQRLSGLDSKTEYSVRVGPIRLCRNSSAVEGETAGEETTSVNHDQVVELAGAFSASTTFVTPSQERLRIAQSRPSTVAVCERKPLSDQQWAMIILFSFTLVALLIAVLVQRLIAL